MQPSPIAETSRLLFPSLLFRIVWCSTSPLFSCSERPTTHLNGGCMKRLAAREYLKAPLGTICLAPHLAGAARYCFFIYADSNTRSRLQFHMFCSPVHPPGSG